MLMISHFQIDKVLRKIFKFINLRLFDVIKLNIYFLNKQVLEVRPLMDWDKGHALEYLLDTLGFDGSDVVPIYLGDDRTDEDAFKVELRNITSY